MKNLLPLFIIIFLLSCNNNAFYKKDEFKKITQVLLNQENSWNNGDIDGFMLGYWNSDKLEFSSKNNTTYGWKNTLEKYKKSYPTKQKMGTLRFEIIDLKLTSDTTAIVNGTWELIRMNDNPQGKFMLTFQKINQKWLIIKDFTTNA